MKKYILLLLLLTFGMQAQTYQNPTYGNLKLKNNIQSTTATKVNVQETDGTINWQFIKDFQNNKPYFSTGLLKNGLLTINADNTKFDLSAGIGVYSDFSDPENVTSKVFNFPAFTAVVSPYIATSNITYVAVNYNSGSPVLVMQASQFSNTQIRDLVVVGAVVHSNFTTINVINNISSPSNDVGNSVADLFNFLGARNQEGNVYSANGANLQLNKSAGVVLKYGANFHVNSKNPHNVAIPEQLGLTFRYRLQGGFEGTDRINVDVDNYDLNNVLTAVPPNKYTIQTIFIPQTGQTRIQYGQTIYNTLADAIAAINTRKFNVENNLATQFVKVAYLVLKKGTTSLQVVTDADIIQASKFDATASGGVAITYQSIIDALTFTPENVVNKVTDIATGANNTTYPTSLAVKSYADNLVVGMLNDRGTWDASVNVFPTTGGSGTAGAIRKGDMWYVSVAGTLGGKAVGVGDSFRALVNTPAQVATNWSVLGANIGYVPESIGNKSDSFTASSSTTYASTKALVDGLAGKEPIFSKNTAFNKNFGTTAGTVAEGNDSRILNGQTAFGWGNHASVGYALSSSLGTNAYSSTPYLPLSGGTLTGGLEIQKSTSLYDSPKSLVLTHAEPANFSGFIGLRQEGLANTMLTFGTKNAGVDYMEALNISNGRVLIGTTTDDGVNSLQVNGSVTATSFNGSATLTGTPTAPTAAAGTNTTQIATTAFVQANARPYKVYTALLTQTGTDAPVATVLENTLGGTVVWSRNVAGEYRGTLNGAFVNNKTTINISSGINTSSYSRTCDVISSNEVNISTWQGGVGTDALMGNNYTSIEIRVYN